MTSVTGINHDGWMIMFQTQSGGEWFHVKKITNVVVKQGTVVVSLREENPNGGRRDDYRTRSFEVPNCIQREGKSFSAWLCGRMNAWSDRGASP